MAQYSDISEGDKFINKALEDVGLLSVEREDHWYDHFVQSFPEVVDFFERADHEELEAQLDNVMETLHDVKEAFDSKAANRHFVENCFAMYHTMRTS